MLILEITRNKNITRILRILTRILVTPKLQNEAVLDYVCYTFKLVLIYDFVFKSGLPPFENIILFAFYLNYLINNYNTNIVHDL